MRKVILGAPRQASGRMGQGQAEAGAAMLRVDVEGTGDMVL